MSKKPCNFVHKALFLHNGNHIQLDSSNMDKPQPTARA